MKDNIIIGIDPDCEKSGVATINEFNEKHISCMSFQKLIEYLFDTKIYLQAHDSDVKLTVYVEAGWLNKSNWHLPNDCSKQVAAAIGNKTGRNHQLGICIVEMCKFYGIKVVEVRPTNTKLKAEQFKKLTGITQRLNQECRDAYMLAFRNDKTTIDKFSDKF